MKKRNYVFGFVILLVGLSIGVAISQTPASQGPWHPIQQVATDSTGQTPVDATGLPGVIDRADGLDPNSPRGCTKTWSASGVNFVDGIHIGLSGTTNLQGGVYLSTKNFDRLCKIKYGLGYSVTGIGRDTQYASGTQWWVHSGDPLCNNFGGTITTTATDQGILGYAGGIKDTWCYINHPSLSQKPVNYYACTNPNLISC